MADDQTAAQTDEQGGSSAILGGGDDDTGDSGPISAPPTPKGPSAAQNVQDSLTNASTALPAKPAGPQVDTSVKVHPHVAILAGLVNKIISGIQNAPGNPNNPLDRGFMAASPQNQQLRQAQVSKAMSEADQAKLQTSITGMKALQLEYMIKRLPQELQNEHLKAISDFKQNLIKEGANIEAEGDDEKASDSQAFHLNGTDARATGHAGRFYSLPTMDADGNAKFDVVYVPNKDTLQNDFKWTDANGDDQTIPAGTPISAALAKFVEAQNKGAQNQTKEQHKQMADALGPVSDDKAAGTADYLQGEQKRNSPIYQQNKEAVDAAIPRLRNQSAERQKKDVELAKQKAVTLLPIQEQKEMHGKAVIAHMDNGDDVLMSSAEASQQGIQDFETVPSKMAQDLRDKAGNAEASMNAMQNYRKSFADSAGKLTKSDRVSLTYLTSKEGEAKSSGLLAGLVDEIPAVGPLSEVANKVIKGSIAADQYEKLSPTGKRLMAQYAMAVVANFANMKQMLGSIGRNPEMIKAEMAQIPQPMVDPKFAETALATKVSDLKQRNASIPKIFHKGPRKGLDEINKEGLWEVSSAE